MNAGEMSPIVQEWLNELRGSHFTLDAWMLFFRRAWIQARSTAQAHPALTRSCLRCAAGVAAAQGGALTLEALVADTRAAKRTAPGALVWMAWASFDCWAHLGMAQAAHDRSLQHTFGLANAATLARRGIAGLLIGRLLSGQPASRSYILTTTVGAIITDCMDGLIARRHQQTSRLGAYLDSIADLEVWTAMIITLGVTRLWPTWLTSLALLRWLAPVAAAARSYFASSRGVVMGSTRAGRIAGVAQALSVGLALAPKGCAQRIAGFRTAVYVLTAAQMIATPLSRAVSVCEARRSGEYSAHWGLEHTASSASRR